MGQKTTVYGAQDRSANAVGSTAASLSDGSRLDQSTDNSIDQKLSGNIGTISGDGNTTLATGATINNVEDVSGDVVGRGLDSLDRANAAAFEFAGGVADRSLGLAEDALGRSLESADAAYAGGLNFGKRALDSTDAAYAGGLGFGEEALKIVSNFGSSTIQNANDRADSALAAVERLAAVPTERNASPDSKLTLLVLGGLALLALLLGARRSSKS